MSEEGDARQKGWQPIPVPLKILFVVFIPWLFGSVMNLPNLVENGLPLFGNFVFGVTAAAVAVLLDIVGPVTFLIALWNRKSWAANWAYIYNGIFVLNNTIAMVTLREELGLAPVLVPTAASLVFLSVIFWKRKYFELRE